MRYQGKITNWNDEKGFGFVTPNGGGEKAFVHIKSFSSRSHRPIEGDLITYELVSDGTRFKAENIRFSSDKVAQASGHTSSFGIIFACIFCFFITSAVFIGRLPFEILGLYLAASTLAFLAYAIDKSAAQNDRWRTKESTLHLFGIVGGWPGALLAQKTLRHKSKKEEFQTVFWATVFINCAALGWLFTKNGSNFLATILGSSA